SRDWLRAGGHRGEILSEKLRHPTEFIEPSDHCPAEKCVFLCKVTQKITPAGAVATQRGNFAPEGLGFHRGAVDIVRKFRIREIFNAVNRLHEPRGDLFD